MAEAVITVLGCGTSMGVPILGCRCATCTSTDGRDKRTRPSIAVGWEGGCVIIDTGPEFRLQALREDITRADAVFYTHGHADHILGLDDLRPLTFKRAADPLPLYADDATATVLERVFDYTFSPGSPYPNKARVRIRRIAGEDTTTVAGQPFQRIPLLHGRLPIAGYRFGRAAYLTDMSSIPDESFALLRDLDVVILDALRWEYHPSHANVAEALQWAEKIGARSVYFTHMSHELKHAETERELPPNVRLLYDGLRIPFEF